VLAERRSAEEDSIFHPEDRARQTIDAQIVEAGWVVQSRDQMNLGAGLGVAVREFATGIGPVDYALVDRTLCGVLEAKPDGTTLSGFAEKAERYMGSVPKHLVRREGQVRFEYVASSTEIQFRDHANPAPRSRRVFFFHRPETLRRWLDAPMTIIRHGGLYYSLLAGMERVDMKADQWVLAGEPVGAMPDASGGALYFELRRAGRPVDPRPWLAAGDQGRDGGRDEPDGDQKVRE
jgi:hypothetical protein